MTEGLAAVVFRALAIKDGDVVFVELENDAEFERTFESLRQAFRASPPPASKAIFLVCRRPFDVSLLRKEQRDGLIEDLLRAREANP